MTTVHSEIEDGYSISHFTINTGFFQTTRPVRVPRKIKKIKTPFQLLPTTFDTNKPENLF